MKSLPSGALLACFLPPARASAQGAPLEGLGSPPVVARRYLPAPSRYLEWRDHRDHRQGDLSGRAAACCATALVTFSCSVLLSRLRGRTCAFCSSRRSFLARLIRSWSGAHVERASRGREHRLCDRRAAQRCLLMCAGRMIIAL